MSRSSSPLERCLIVLALLLPVINAFSLRFADASLRSRETAAPGGAYVTCLDYSSIANLSTIGSNATMRAAYLQAAPDGTDHSAKILNDAEAKLPPLTANVALNAQCGNLTTIAKAEAANNFTQGIVAQYRIRSSAGGRNQVGAAVVACWVAIGVAFLL